MYSDQYSVTARNCCYYYYFTIHLLLLLLQIPEVFSGFQIGLVVACPSAPLPVWRGSIHLPADALSRVEVGNGAELPSLRWTPLCPAWSSLAALLVSLLSAGTQALLP